MLWKFIDCKIKSCAVIILLCHPNMRVRYTYSVGDFKFLPKPTLSAAPGRGPVLPGLTQLPSSSASFHSFSTLEEGRRSTGSQVSD